jgi:hypothetical protein
VSQHQQKIDECESELAGLRSRLQQSLTRNLIAERPSQSLLGGMRGDPLMLHTGIEKQTLVETKKREKKTNELYQLTQSLTYLLSHLPITILTY